MAGVMLHWAMGDPDLLDPGNPAFTASVKKAYALGLLLPDIAKQGLIGNVEEYCRFFAGCSPDDIPTYEEYLAFSKNNHFSPDPTNPSQQDTRKPDLRAFADAGYTDLKKAVWQGVLCHLMGDRAFYYGAFCVDDPRAMDDYAREVGVVNEWDGQKWRASQTGRTYYNDYDLLNQRIEDEYGLLGRLRTILSAPLLRELLDRFHVEFSSSREDPEYMNLKNIRRYIACSRRLAKGIGNGEVEEILRFFDEDGLKDLFGE